MICSNCQYDNVKSAEHCASCGVQLGDAFVDTLDPQFHKAEVKSHVKYAGFWIRFLAYFIDGFLVGIVVNILAFIAGVVIGVSMGGAGADMGTMEIIAGLVGGLIGLVIGWLYYALQESSEKQATLGKSIVGIKVTDLNGERLTFGRATGRYFAKWLSALTLCIGYIMAGFTDKKQALHDTVASTLVVHK